MFFLMAQGIKKVNSSSFLGGWEMKGGPAGDFQMEGGMGEVLNGRPKRKRSSILSSSLLTEWVLDAGRKIISPLLKKDSFLPIP